jgi:hypothetical protein
MAKMVKENKVLVVSDELVPQYLSEGYDHVEDETGEVITPATAGRTVSLAELNAVKAELKEVKQQLAEAKEENEVLIAENDKITKSLRSIQQNNRNSK